MDRMGSNVDANLKADERMSGHRRVGSWISFILTALCTEMLPHGQVRQATLLNDENLTY